jgi:hypothetical protein
VVKGVSMRRPPGITVIAAVSALAAAYLGTIAAIRLVAPEAVSLMAAKHFMYGFEVAGPFMMLLFGAGYALVGWGLFRLHNWARWVAMLVMVLGVASLVPGISMAELGVRLFWYGLQIALRVAVGWYLAQAPAVIDAFAAKA